MNVKTLTAVIATLAVGAMALPAAANAAGVHNTNQCSQTYGAEVGLSIVTTTAAYQYTGRPSVDRPRRRRACAIAYAVMRWEGTPTYATRSGTVHGSYWRCSGTVAKTVDQNGNIVAEDFNILCTSNRLGMDVRYRYGT